MLSYSGDILSHQAWKILMENNTAYLVDVRTKEELAFVGNPDLSSIHKHPIFIEWRVFPEMKINPHFQNELLNSVHDKEATLLFLCRSGARSMEAARAIAELGYINCYNISDGFEGNIDINFQRGNISGWKASKLPWRQN
jgi:rhodanese-related sulfurtransferase